MKFAVPAVLAGLAVVAGAIYLNLDDGKPTEPIELFDPVECAFGEPPSAGPWTMASSGGTATSRAYGMSRTSEVQDDETLVTIEDVACEGFRLSYPGTEYEYQMSAVDSSANIFMGRLAAEVGGGVTMTGELTLQVEAPDTMRGGLGLTPRALRGGSGSADWNMLLTYIGEEPDVDYGPDKQICPALGMAADAFGSGSLPADNHNLFLTYDNLIDEAPEELQEDLEVLRDAHAYLDDPDAWTEPDPLDAIAYDEARTALNDYAEDTCGITLPEEMSRLDATE